MKREEKSKLIVLNNKCNFTLDKYELYLKKLNDIFNQTDCLKKNKVVFCPSSCYLAISNKTNLILGSQDVSVYECGPYTGEIASSQLKSLGVEYTIVGHQERRIYNKETNYYINKKIKQLLKEGIIPILCIGEYEKKDINIVVEEIKKELVDLFANINSSDIGKVIIAYEPYWLIGSSSILKIEDIDYIMGEIRKTMPNNILIYGGGICCENIKDLEKSKYIQGYILGGMSLEVDKLYKFLQEV